MKRMDLFCTSQAATAVCRPRSMDEASSSSSPSSSSSLITSSSSSVIQLGGGGRAIDRHNPIIRDPRRIGRSLPPCSSHQPPPSTPSPSRKTHVSNNINRKRNEPSKKKSSASKTDDQKRKSTSSSAEPENDAAVADNKEKIITRKFSSWSCTKPGDFISPPGSTRYLLGDNRAFLDPLPSSDTIDPPLKSVPKVEDDDKSSGAVSTAPAAVKTPPRSPDQVVVLRVSLHCKGCERKMRKHISRMQGVTSFNIDFAAKKVTVVGDVTPLEVLASISKVKNAKLWTPPVLSSSTNTPLNLNYSPFNFKNFE